MTKSVYILLRTNNIVIYWRCSRFLKLLNQLLGLLRLWPPLGAAAAATRGASTTTGLLIWDAPPIGCGTITIRDDTTTSSSTSASCSAYLVVGLVERLREFEGRVWSLTKCTMAEVTSLMEDWISGVTAGSWADALVWCSCFDCWRASSDEASLREVIEWTYSIIIRVRFGCFFVQKTLRVHQFIYPITILYDAFTSKIIV